MVTGMHRSGTSLVAAAVAAGDVWMGDRLVSADRNNRHGYHEDAEFLELDRAMLAAVTPADDGGHPDWGWTEHDRRSRDGLARFAAAAGEVVAARGDDGRRWGWKDPRTSLLLDFWHPLLPDPAYVLVYRSPWDVADSMQRLGADVFVRNPAYASAVWASYNQHLLDFRRRHRERTVLVAVEALLADPARACALLRDRIGIELPETRLRELVDASAIRVTPPGDPLASLTAAVHPQVTALLAELDAEADLAPARTARPTAGPAADRAGAPRVAVVIPCFDQGDTLVEAVASAQRVPEPVEIVVVDDGSQDPETLRVLDVLRDEGVVVHRQQNAGVAAARNAGVARTRAPAILPLDADNRLRPAFVSRALDALAASPEVGAVYGDRAEFGLRNGDVDVPEFDLPTLLAYNVIDACAVVRRSAWDDVGGHTGLGLPGWEDWDFWIGVAAHGWEFRHLQTPGFEYRVRPDSMLSTTSADDVRERLYAAVISRHEVLYREHLPRVLMLGQRAATDLSAISRELEAANARVEERDAELDRLHEAVRVRVEEVRWLHGEVAERDEEIRRLHREVALRDARVDELSAKRERTA